MPTRENLTLFLNLAALAYAMLLVVAFALTAYRELLDSHYVWFIVWAIPLPLFARLTTVNEDDGLVYTLIYCIGCILAALIGLILISVTWSREGSFYLGLSGVDGGFTALWILVVTLALQVVTGSGLVALLISLARHSVKSK